ncbi:polysaccharide pyruvyl transferase family protein [Pseudomonas sp. DP-17]|uniref:polysaccharide pyruvyl transferase family protein n=1 Tax=Pseudomonas sp. DP-17 TaxID=1580486 RepID=UPI001EFC24E0|nr:polysaccharide pyruvyl transferase family protein [Pseudomonas sp. DP-17]MCG8910866.1 polysaccharide pyruvyl transferase family protein [Pseudomonas sp. DP-17]
MNGNSKIVLCGWYGASNIGDELLLGAIVDWIKELGGEPTIISLNPAHTEQVYGVPAVDFHNLGGIGQALAESDLFVMGGGGIFQDHHPFNTCALYDPLMSDIAQYARPFYMAQQFGLKTMILAHGVGPLRSQQARAIASDVFSKADVVTVRDEQSTELLRSIGVTRPIVTAPDPGWHAANQVIQKLAPDASDAPHGSKKTLGLIIREWPKAEGWSDKLVAAINAQLPENWQCVWLAFQHSLDEQRAASDRPYLEQLSDALTDRIEDRIVDCIEVDAMTAELARCDSLVSMRLHGSILAIALGKPCVFLEYDDKMVKAHEMAGVPGHLRIDLSAPLDSYKELISTATQPNDQAPAWIIAQNTHDSLQQAALAHRNELSRLLNSLSVEDRARRWESNKGFDWLSAWMQELIWQNREIQRASDRAHALLRYKESLLHQQTTQAESLENISKELSLQFEELQLEAQQLHDSIDERSLEIQHLQDAIQERVLEAKHLQERIEGNTLEIQQHQETISSIRADNEAKTAYILEKEIHVAMLEQFIQQKSKSLGSKMAGALRVLTPKIQRAIYLLQNGGPSALLSALKRRRQMQAALNEEPLVSIPAYSVNVDDVYFSASARLRQEEIVIFANHGFSTFGEQHRAAQLARAALSAGHRVIYISPTAEPAPRHVAGMLNLALSGLTRNDLFKKLSEHSIIIYLNGNAEVIPFAKYAKDRGLTTVLDTSHYELASNGLADSMDPQLAELVDRICITLPETASYFDSTLSKKILSLPQAASHTYFDIYKQYQKPSEWQMENREKGLLLVTDGTDHWVDWNYLKRCAEQNDHMAFYVLGAEAVPDMPQNVGFLPIHCLEQANSFVAHADFLLVPVKEAIGSTGHAMASILSGLFLGKPVICSKEVELIDSVLHYPTPAALNIGRFEASKQKNNDLLVAGNSWLSRLEQLIPERPRHDVSVVILIHNNAKIIGRCLQTLLQHCSAYISEVIVVDNASSDDGAAIVERDFPSVKLVRNPENGCSSGRNLGVEHATGKYIAFFDSDQWFTGSSGFAEALAILEENANVGVIGWNAGWFDATRTDLGGMIADYCPNRAMNAQAIRDGYRSDIGFLGTSGFFMRRATFDAIDGFDTFYDPTCFEDTDLCFQIRALDMEVSFRDLSGIRHQPHQTTGADSGSDRYKKLFLRNSSYFKGKWQSHPEYFLDYTP